MGKVSRLAVAALMLIAATINIASGNCPKLSVSTNLVADICTNSNKPRSVCTVSCGPGLERTGGGTRLICWCTSGVCTWQGAKPTCKASTCPTVDYNIENIHRVDSWPKGFAILIDFGEIAENIDNGWTMVIVFDRALGQKSSLFSWNTRLTAVSSDKRTFTLNSADYNKDFSEYFAAREQSTSLVIVTDVEGIIPTRAYVGLFKTPLKDASCTRAVQYTTFTRLLNSGTQPFVPMQPETTATTTTTAKPIRTVLPVATTKATTTTSTIITTTITKTVAATTKTQATTTAKITAPSSTIIPTADADTSNEDDPPIKKINGRFCKLQKHDDHFNTQRGWVDDGLPYFNGNAVIKPVLKLNDWSMLLVFNTPILSIEVWNCEVTGHSDSGHMWTFGPFSWNNMLEAAPFDISFIAKQKFATPTNPTALVYLCSNIYKDGDVIKTSPDAATPPTTPTPVMESVSFTPKATDTVTVTSSTTTVKPPIKKPVVMPNQRCLLGAPSGVVIERAPQTKILPKINHAQRAGKLPLRYKRIPWRGHSALKDGCEINVDLTKGWFDAGDHVKFNFPMAFSVTTLAWGGILFRDAYRDAGEINRLLGSIKWPVDYLMACHISKYEFIGQIGNPKVDHDWWGRPEQMPMYRPIYKINKEKPGSELAAEAAAALASSSILLKKTARKTSIAALVHAKELFEFADKYKGLYHISIPQASSFYRSASGYDDELLWAAAWLYKSSGDEKYLERAKEIYTKMRAKFFTGPMFSWDHKLVGAQDALLANLTGEAIFRDQVEKFVNNMMEMEKTSQGMIYYQEWAPNKYAANAAFIALVAATLEPPLAKKDLYLEFAEKQIGLLVGDAGMSYVIGYGKKYPTQPHHRASSCPQYPTRCEWDNAFDPKAPNPYILHGALVGGPTKAGLYYDVRSNFKQSEVSCDNNAGFQSAVAGLKHFAMKTRPEIVTPKPKRRRG